MYKIKTENFEKRKKKAVTVYLDEDNYDYVKERSKSKPVSSIFNDVLSQIADTLKEEELREDKKIQDVEILFNNEERGIEKKFKKSEGKESDIAKNKE